VPKNQQGIVKVPWNNARLFYVDLAWVIYNVNPSAPTRIRRLHNPQVFGQRPGAICALAVWHHNLLADLDVDLFEMLAKTLEIIRHYERIGNKIEVLFLVLLLHALDVYCHKVFASELNAYGEVINLLVLAQSFIEVWFACSVGPQHVPVVSVCLNQAIEMENETNKFRIAL